MPITVDVPELGESIDFPDGMSHEDIATAIKGHLTKIAKFGVEKPAETTGKLLGMLTSPGVGIASGMGRSQIEKPELQRQQREAQVAGDIAASEAASAGVGEQVADFLRTFPKRAVNAPFELAQAAGIPLGKPTISPEQVGYLRGKLGDVLQRDVSVPPQVPGPKEQALYDWENEQLSGLTTPEMVAAPVAAKAAPEAVGRLFQGMMATGVPEAVQQTVEAPDAASRLKGALSVAAAGGLPLAIERGLARPLPGIPDTTGRLLRTPEGARPSPAAEAAHAAGVDLTGEPTTTLSPTAEGALTDILQGQKGAQNAANARIEQQGSQPEYPRAAPRPDVPINQPEVRQEQGQQASGGDSPKPSAEVQGSEPLQPLTPEQQAEERRRLDEELGQETEKPQTYETTKKPPIQKGTPKTDTGGIETVGLPPQNEPVPSAKTLRPAQSELSVRFRQTSGPFKDEVIVSPSTREPGRWQVTLLKDPGDGSPLEPSGHATFDTKEEAIRSAKGETVNGVPGAGSKSFQEVTAPPVEPSAEPAPATAPKEPWQMTQADYVAKDIATRKGVSPKFLPKMEELARQDHQAEVQHALRQGKPVPPEVLADYPDLQPPPSPAQTKGETKPSNAWQVKTPKGKKVINIDPEKHSVVMGKVVDKATGKTIGTLVKKIEPTTAPPTPPPVAKVEAQVQKVARTEGQRSAKEVKSELVQKIEDAMRGAPEKSAYDAAKHGHVEIDIPGDGHFKVPRNLEALSHMRDEVKSLSTSPTAPAQKVPASRMDAADFLRRDVMQAIQVYGDEATAYKKLSAQLARREELGIEAEQAKRLKKLVDQLEKNILAGWERARSDLQSYSRNVEANRKKGTPDTLEQEKMRAQLQLKIDNELAAVKEKLGRLPWEKPEPPPPAAPPAEKGPEGEVKSDLPPGFQGPGAARVGDVPAAPPQAVAIGGRVEQAAPENRPLGAVSPISVALNNARRAISTTLKGIAGATMPKTTAANRLVGEAGARYLSSRIAARPLAATFSARVLQNTGVDPIKLGAALTEDNLRSIREAMVQKLVELRAEGKIDESMEMQEQADKVSTIIGSKGSPFPTEEDYFDFLEDPKTKKAIGQHLQLWQETIDPQYRDAQNIDPDVELPSRGQQTGARINLKAVLPDQPATRPVVGTTAGLTATLKRKSPFAVKARGTGQAYDVDYHSIIRNTFERQLEIANKNAFDALLEQNGLASVDKPGRTVMIGDKPAVGFPLQRKVVVSSGKDAKTFSLARNIYVRADLADEYRAASGVDRRYRIPIATPIMDGLNRLALAGLTDATVHVSNQMTALFNRPVSGKFWADTLLSATGRADVPVTLTRAIIKSLRDNEAQASELAEIGAMRQQGDIHYGVFGKMLHKTDKITRLMLDDTFKELVRKGLVENTETARREYVNQIGQYNRRAQGFFTRLARDVGFGPFVTAGKTFNALGVRMLSMDPGAPAANKFAAAALRANVLSKWIGAATVVAAMNYMITGKMLGRPGTPFGNIDTGKKDKAGKQLSLPFLSLIGLGRGLRVTGVKGAIDAKRMGLTDSDAIDAATRDIANSWSAPFAGPATKFGAIALTGYQPAINVGRASRVVPPGESQFNQNVGDAIRQSSPVIQTYIKAREGKSVPEILSTQIPRFTAQPGKTESMVANYPKIVSMAQGAAFIDDVVHEARRMDPDKRKAFVAEQIKRLPPSQREHAYREVVRRRVFR